MNKIIEKLKELAGKDAFGDNEEDIDIYSGSGGNFDDAYAIGFDDGRIDLARELLKLLEE